MGIIQTNPGSPGANAGASGGKIYSYNAVTNANNIGVAPANQQRNSITFHNPGANDILVSPTQSLGNLGASYSTLTPTTAALGGGFRVFAGATLTISGECQQAWQALALVGTTNPFTVMDSNI